MFAYLTWEREGRPGVTLTREQMGGAPFYCLRARGAPRRIKRRVARATAELGRRGVRRCVSAPAWPEAWCGSLKIWEDRRLRQALLPQLLSALCRRQAVELGDEAVLLSAPQVSAEVWQAAELLAQRSRYLLLELPDSAPLQNALWRRYGLSAAAFAPRYPAIQVCFGAPRANVPALLLGEESFRRQQVEYTLPPDWEERLAPAVLTPSLVAALWECGALPAEEICVKSLTSNA